MSSISEMMSGIAGHGAPQHEAPSAEQGEGGGGHTELHPHGDGTYHSVAGGEQTEHPHIGHALAHIAQHHEPDGAHSHVHHEEGGAHVSHHAKDGQVSGPHSHENLDALKTHLDQFLGEEGHESYDGGGKGEHGHAMAAKPAAGGKAKLF